jgi:Protein of unknown function (DUF3040)
MVTISSGCLPDAQAAAYTGSELIRTRGGSRAVVQEDPKLASTLRGTNLRRAAQRRAILAGVCFVAGLAVLMAGAITRLTVVGILGFVIMLGSATVGLAAVRGTSSGHRPPARTQQPGSMLDRFGTPWRRRHDDES